MTRTLSLKLFDVAGPKAKHDSMIIFTKTRISSDRCSTDLWKAQFQKQTFPALLPMNEKTFSFKNVYIFQQTAPFNTVLNKGYTLAAYSYGWNCKLWIKIKAGWRISKLTRMKLLCAINRNRVEATTAKIAEELQNAHFACFYFLLYANSVFIVRSRFQLHTPCFLSTLRPEFKKEKRIQHKSRNHI